MRILRTLLIGLLATLVVSSTSVGLAQQPLSPPPFQDAVRRPSVSPYLQLLQPQTALGVPNYQTLVRPEIEMREAEARNRQAIEQLQRQVSRSMGPQATTGISPFMRPTGQSATFMNTLHYFPQMRR